ncbi:MAG: hypothetical protein Tsb0034_09780 [Ekhidna sp.]
MPGMTDGHVHLYKEEGKVFRDAALYLSKGVTTVFNMRGDSTHFAWRDMVRNGNLIAPYIYTCGEFINEPLVNSPEEVTNEVLSQQSQGVDFLKFHEYFSDKERRYLTTEGVSKESFNRLMATAKTVGLPVTGHGMYDPDFENLLEQGMSLAHLSGFLEYQLFPDGQEKFQAAFPKMKWLLSLIVTISIILFIIFQKTRKLLLILGVSTLLFFGVWFNTIWLGNNLMILLMIVSAATILFLTVFITVKIRLAKSTNLNILSKMALVIPTTLFGYYVILLWIPIFLKNTDGALDELIHKAKGSSIITTMIVEDPNWSMLDHGESLKYLPEPIAERWSNLKGEPSNFIDRWVHSTPKMSYWYLAEKKLLRKLKKHGINVVAGTDAMGFPLMVPGYSAHYELKLIHENGYSAFETLQTATRNPAKFLNQESNFGTIEKGKRADMVLLNSNPLEDIEAINSIEGVLVNGNWINKEGLSHMLDSLNIKNSIN